jgi:hypothetical protein
MVGLAGNKFKMFPIDDVLTIVTGQLLSDASFAVRKQ